MKKKILKCISVVMMIFAMLAVVLLFLTFINPNSGGFIDLTNVVRYLIAFIAGYFGWKK